MIRETKYCSCNCDFHPHIGKKYSKVRDKKDMRARNKQYVCFLSWTHPKQKSWLRPSNQVKEQGYIHNFLSCKD